MASSIARRKVVERVSARVFCHLEEAGGNPVTIFSSQSPLSSSTQEKLAQDCDWESVMVQHRSLPSHPKLSFYMPSGEQVSFCAHAAMGAALEICNQTKAEDEDEVTLSVDDTNYETTIYEGDIVALQMKDVYEHTLIGQKPMLNRMLRDYCRLDARDLASTPLEDNDEDTEQAIKLGGTYPVLCHASIARPKTLIPVRSMENLHSAKPPKESEGFARACKALDDTTGLYLYCKSKLEDGAWECRQFPRASGYPEDPATGIAAGALACYFFSQHDLELPAYKFYQGTAMGKSSLIVVDELTLKRQELDDEDEETLRNASYEAFFRLLGRVQIDKRDSMEVVDNEE